MFLGRVARLLAETVHRLVGCIHQQPALGPGVVRRLERGSAAIIKNTDDNVELIKVAFGRLRSTLKELYPDRLFVDFKFKESKD